MMARGNIFRGLEGIGLRLTWVLLLFLSVACVNNTPPKIDSAATDDSSTVVPLPAGFTLMSAVGGSSSIALAWTTSLNASKYQVMYRRLEQSEFTIVGETASTSTVIPGLADGVVYAVKVMAVNRTGVIASNELTAAPQSNSAVAPSLSYVGSAGTTGPINALMTVVPKVLFANGAVITNCTISPALPAGLSINTSTCIISGTPTSVSSTTYSVRAFNSMGASNPASVTLTITGLVPSLSYAQASGTVGTRNVAMAVTPTQLSTNGSPITNCSIAPALPAGLSINTTNCRISGTPTVTLPSTVFGVTATNAIGSSAPALVTLAVVPSCPTGYVGVPGSPLMGTDDFCVMQYEAKCAGTSCPTSVASATAQPASVSGGYPWTNLTATQAKAACNQLGFEYDLISNPEWMTIARHVEGVAANWSGGAVGAGCLFRGNVGIFDNCSYNGQDPEMGSSRDLKASLVLANSARIWDFSGNVWEWVDWNLNTGLQRGPLTCPSSSVELGQVACTGLAATEFRPLQALSSLQGAGLFTGGTGGAALRGGNWSSANSAGAFALFLSNTTSTSGTPFGFRCVMRPNTPPSVPVLSYFGSTGTVASIGQSMTVVPTTLSTGGSPITNCSVNPALPLGLAISASTCVISGTPAQGVNNVTYSVMATNANGTSTPAFVTLTTSAQVPALSYAGATGTSGNVGSSISVSPTTLNSNGAAITNCSVTPALPFGLTLNPATCVISGVPTTVSSETNYSIRAQNSVGQSAAASVILSVTSVPALSYAGSSGTVGLVGQPLSVAPTTLTSVATLSSCVSTPALPAGLVLNAQTCVITGTVSAPVTGTYSIVATSSIGASAPASVTLTIGANAPVLSYVGSTGTVGVSGVAMSVAPTTLNANGSPLTYCGVRIPTTPLPAWASVNPLTCVISGTPTAPMGSTTYILRASNASGSSADALVTLRVDANVPTLSYATSPGKNGNVNQPMSVVPSTFLNNGSAVTSCSVTPTLPPGLALNATTCLISGTPTTIFGPSSFSVRATNGIGQSPIASVVLSTAPSVPSLSYAGAAGTVGSIGNLMTVTPTLFSSNGSAITNCTVTPALPAGLALNATTCVISGTPSALSPAAAYAVTATNGIGSSLAASVTLQVIDVPGLSFVGSTGTSGTAGFSMSVAPTALVTNGSSIIACTASPALPAGLTLNPATCAISGTPTVAIGATVFNITASNAAGSSAAAPVTLTIAAGVPTLSYFGSTGTNGTVNAPMTVTPTTLQNNGSPITNCTVSPALPAGFSLNPTTCVISGTPTVTIPATTFAVTALNAQGSSAAANVILSTGANPPTISYSGAIGLIGQLGTPRSIAPTTLNFNGTPVTNCTVSPALPAGLSINITTCVISGTVSTTFSTTFQVTAINGAGASVPASVTISSTPAVPTLSYAASTGTTGQAGQPMSITPSTFNNNGAAITNCVVTPALPAGLFLNPATCAISGTPTAVIGATAFNVTASNSIGASVPAALSLTVNPGPPSLSYLGATGTFGAIGAPMTITPTALQTNGAAITACAASPALPAGLSVNATTCVISGTPSVAVPLASYTITVTNSVGSSNATVNLSTAVDPPVLSYVGSSGTAGNIGVPFSVTPTTLNDNGAPVTSCGVRVPTTPLPTWATVNPTTCVISGTPDASLAPTVFTLVATNVAGDSSDATVTLSVGASAPSLSYAGATGTTGVIGQPMTITPTTFSTNGAPITNCAAVPSLPAGLSLDTATCVISGAPANLLSATTYFISATNSAGSSSAAPVTIAVVATAPTLSYAGATGTAGTIYAAMSVTPTTLVANGSPVTNCTVTPALPSGLGINPTTCVISGNPAVSLTATTFSVIATNGMGPSATATVTLSVGAIAPSLSYAGALGTTGNMSQPMTVAPTTLNPNGATVTNCSITPALPAGLSLSTTTCVISGTPANMLAPSTYNVTATNSAGTSAVAGVTLTVQAGVPSLSYAGASGTNGTVGQPMTIAPTSLVTNGSAITNCVSSPALPTGLSLNPTTCVISGTPSANITPAVYTITAQNAAGSSLGAGVTLSTGPNPPSLSYSGSTGDTIALGTSFNVAPSLFSPNGATVTSCSVVPTLPSGVSINSSNCVITGTPSTTLPSTTYTVIATNAAGSSPATTVTLRVIPGVPTLSYFGAAGTNGQVGTPMSVAPTTLSANSSTIIGCSTSPALPPGFVIDVDTCVISGTAATELAPTVFSVVATNLVGNSQPALVTLSTGINPPSLSYSGATGTTVSVGEAMTVAPTILATNGASITNCVSSPALPAGLSLNSSNCVITGIRSSTLPATTYNITASNSAGSSASAPVTLTVTAGKPQLSYLGASGTNGSVGSPMTVAPSVFNSNGSAVTACTVSPGLPAGLSLNAATCVISGTPSASIAPTIYSVTAINAVGPSSAALVTLSTGSHPPTLSFAGATGTIGTLGQPMQVDPTALSSNGSIITGCVSSPALPAGLTLNSSTCRISGTPQVPFTSIGFSLVATNAIGDSTPAEVYLEVQGTVPSLSYLGATGTNQLAGAPFNVTPTSLQSNGSPITNCTSDPALPAGLSLNPSTCVITGSVATDLAPTTFSIRAFNVKGGSNAATVTLSTGPNLPTISFAGSTGTFGTFGQPMSVSPTDLSANGSAITGCLASPSLPAGLSINSTTCVISGTPTQSLATTTFTVTVYNSEGTDSDTVGLTIQPGVPTLSYAGSFGTSGSVGFPMSVTPTTLSANGSPITSCNISPGLPPGLSINPTTCVISGTPTSNITPTIYSVTANNATGGSSPATVTLSTGINPPTISYSGSTGTTITLGQSFSVTPTTLSSNGSSITGCVSTPALPSGVVLNSTSCVISGTPASALPSTTFNVQAINSAGNSVAAPVTLTVNPGLPTLSYVGASGTNGDVGQPMSVTPTALNPNGASITNCTSVPSLPAGLALNPNTCVISGTPAAPITPTIFQITATNAVGNGPAASVALSTGANPPTLSYADSTGKSVAVGDAFNIIPSVLATNGSALTNCVAVPALPAGLILNTSNCVVTGSLSAPLPGTSYVITATNASGDSDPAPLTIEVTGDVPSLSYAGSAGTNGTVGVPMTVVPSTFNDNGSTVTSCQVTPALPAGLSINQGSCVISGTPSTNISPTIFTIKALNAVGFSEAALVTLSTGTHPPTLSYSGATGTTGLINTPMSVTPTILASNGSTIISCDITPALPAGLAINPTTCVISGTPTSALAATNFSVIASNGVGGSSPAAVTLSVNAGAPVLSYLGATGTNAAVGAPMTITPTTLQANGAAITGCSSDPALPAGLSINPTTCVISGSVAFTLPPTNYNIRATNSVGQSEAASVVISTGNTNPPSISFAGATGTTGTINAPMSVTPTTLNGNGSAITSCLVSPPLPAGLSLNSTTCVISGTPTVVSGATAYTVTVDNGVATANTSVTLTVNAQLPTLSFAGATGTTGSVGSPMLVVPTTLDGNGAPITNCTISPALPSGLEIDTTTCEISGTPATSLPETVYSVTAVNSAGSSPAATVTLSTEVGVPILSYENAVGTYGDVGTPMSVIPTQLEDNGAAITGCTISPPLPNGLTLHPTTCVISGTPTESIGATQFQVVAQNPQGNSTPAPLTLSTSGLTGPPTLSYVGATGTIINFPNPLSVFPTTLNGNGSDILNCGVKPMTTPLPAWAEIDPLTCEIFGTPTGTMPNTTFTIVAGNIFGTSNDATVTIRVAPGVPVISYVDAEGTLAAVNGTMNIVPTVFQNNGATVTNCVATPALPAGVSISPSTCVISGTPVTPQPPTTYQVRATNVTGQSAPAAVTIEVAQKPILDYDDPNPRLKLMAGRPITPIVPIELVGGGADIINCQSTPPLPAGLVLDPVTCTISGTPSGVDGNYVEYNVVAFSAVAESNPARIEIEVEQGPPSLSYVGATGTEASVGVETTITPTIFNANGNTITDCSSDPALPDGLTIDQNTCVISGTMTAPQPLTTYTITVTSDYDPPGVIDDPADSQSTAEVSIVGVSCPPGYIKILANNHYGTADFCVMENEARCKGKNCVYNLTTPVKPDPDFAIADAVNTVELPWVNIAPAMASRACEFNGYKYDLISNREWMALAQAISERGENWTAPNFTVGQGCLMQGNSGVLDPNCGYKSGDPFNPQNIGEIESPTNAFYSRHKTSDTDGISDLAGNVAEWVDWEHGTEGIQWAPSNCVTFDDGDIELHRIDNEVFNCLGNGSGDLRQRDYLPRTSIGQATAAKGLGMFYARNVNNTGAALRGGDFSSETMAGIYGLELDRLRDTIDPAIGFRCVWRPGTVPTRPNVTFSPSSKTGKVGVEFQFVPEYLETNDDRLTGCTISPALPSGLLFDATFCEVIGTPTTTSPPTNYTITPRNRAGNTLNPATITIRIDP